MWFTVTQHVNADEKDFADVVTMIVAGNLRIDPRPTLQFFAPHRFGAISASAGCAGFTRPSDTTRIFIRSGLPARTLFAVICHELKHCAQLRSIEWRNRNRRFLERDATIFQHQMPLVPSTLTFSEAQKWLLRWNVRETNKKIAREMGLSEWFTSGDIEIR